MQDQNVQDTLNEIYKSIQEPLDTDNPKRLQEQVTDAERYRSHVSVWHAETKSLLSFRRNQYLLPKSKDATDMDRNIHLDDATRGVQEQKDVLKDLLDILNERVSLGQTLITTSREEMKNLNA